MNLLIVIAFIIGYCAIIFEKKIKIDKAASAIITGVFCWTLYIFSGASNKIISGQLMAHMGEIAAILFFLLGAMTIVELIDAHDGFEIITKFISQTNKRKLVWIVGFITFFLSLKHNLCAADIPRSLPKGKCVSYSDGR